jgi:tRNA (Thr-GGU) A37 N-methylase
MEFEEEVVLLVLLHEKLTEKKRKHTRKFWIHPLLNSRQERGVFYTTSEQRVFIYNYK